MGTPHTLMLLLLASIVIVSAKPHRAPNSERLHNRRGWFDSVEDTFQDWGETLTDTASKVGEHVSTWDDAIVDAAVDVKDAVSTWDDVIVHAAGDVKDAVVDTFDKRAVNPVSINDNNPEQMVPGSLLSADSLPENRFYNRRGWFDSVGDTFQDWGETLSDTASKVGEHVSTWDDAIVDAAVDVKDAVSTWDDVIVDAAGNVKDAVVDTFDKRAVNPVNVEEIIPEQKVPVSPLDAATFPEKRLYSRREWFDSVGDTFQY